jgi:sortase A
MPRSTAHTVTGPWLWAERLTWAVAIVALSIWAVARVTGAVSARRAVHEFKALQGVSKADAASPDLSLWSPERIRAWRDSLTREAPPALALLRIPRIGLEVPVLAGTDDWTLNRAVGHIEDTAKPGTDGNSGIAGHRDGFFRGLKDIGPGDTIELETLGTVQRYRVERTWIVLPEEVSVLDPTPTRAITLVTCYPFYFIGSAPQRFIVRAVHIETSRREGI